MKMWLLLFVGVVMMIVIMMLMVMIMMMTMMKVLMVNVPQWGHSVDAVVNVPTRELEMVPIAPRPAPVAINPQVRRGIEIMLIRTASSSSSSSSSPPSSPVTSSCLSSSVITATV
jgi:hypothetical protein